MLKKGINFPSHPQYVVAKGNQLFSQLNTIEAMAKDVRIVESINAIFNANEFPFVLLYDP